MRRNGALTSDVHTSEVVDNFNYLGTIINYEGTYILNQEHLAGKALKAMNILFFKCKTFDLSQKKLSIFYAFVGSILSYSLEISGITKSKELERIHLKFCKRLF